MELKRLVFGRRSFASGSCREPNGATPKHCLSTPAGSARRLRAKQALALAPLLGLALSFGACTRTVTNETADSGYDATEQANATLSTVSHDTDQSVPSAYHGSNEGKVHFAATTTQQSYARGVFNVNVSDGYAGQAAAAFYFPPGTLSGSSPIQKGDLDVLRWDNERTKGSTSFDLGGIRISGSDHLARLIRQQGTNTPVAIGSPFRLQEGCWNWIWVHQRLSANTSTALNEVYLNGDKVVYSNDQNDYGRGVDDVKVGMVGIDASAQSGSPLDFYVDDATIANNAEYIPPRTTVCQPQSGARPYYQFDSKGLNDRMSVGVNLASGNLILKANDLNIAGTGLDLSVNRYYNSQLQSGSPPGTSTGPDLGPHWLTDTGPDIHLVPTSDGGAIFHAPGGYVVTFLPDGSGGYTTPTGINATLTKNNDESYALRFNRTGTTYSFTSDGRLSSIVDQNGNRISYDYGANLALSSIADTQGRTVDFTYTSGKLTGINDQAGRSWGYAYTGDNLTSYTDPENHTTSYQYLSDGRLNKIIDPLGNITTVTYNSAFWDRVSSIIRKDITTGVTHTTTYSYGTGGVCQSDQNRTNVTNARGYVSRYCSDNSGRIVRAADANGNARTATYNGNSDLKAYTSPVDATLGVNATFNYDAQSNSLMNADTPTSSSSTADLVTNVVYDTSVNNQNPYKQYYPAALASPDGTTATRFGYDSSGNVVSIADDIGTTTLRRDPQGRVIQLEDGNHNITNYDYADDPKHHTLRVVNAPPAPARPTSITYDSRSRVATVTDGKNQQRSYSYDELDRIAQVTFDDGSSTSYTYDANGNVLTRVDQAASSSKTTSYTYDGFNSLTKEQFPSGKENNYTYDAVGSPASLTFPDSGGRVTYAYDPADQLVSIAEPGGSCVPSLEVRCTRFTYDSDGNRTTTSYPNGWTINDTYDAADRVFTVYNDGPGLVHYMRYGYVYDDHSGRETNLIQEVEFGSNLPPYGYPTFYGYDQRGRVTSAQYYRGNGEYDNYQYDADSNITQHSTQAGNTYYGYDAANELCWSGPTPAPSICTPPPGATSYNFDANGNETGSSAGLNLIYNAADQTAATQMQGEPRATSIGYLGPSQRERVSEGSVTFQDNVLGLGVRTDANGPVYFVRDDGGTLVAARPSTGGEYYYLFDGLGSVVGLTDSNGNLVRSYSYDPYGNVASNNDLTGNGSAPVDYFRFAGGYQGRGLLYHFGLRYYDSITGRWTQPEPFDPGKLVANRYAYVGGDPVNVTDLGGECKSTSACLAMQEKNAIRKGILFDPQGYWTCDSSGECVATAALSQPASSGPGGQHDESSPEATDRWFHCPSFNVCPKQIKKAATKAHHVYCQHTYNHHCLDFHDEIQIDYLIEL
jgi:RHS repeat-associated protein